MSRKSLCRRVAALGLSAVMTMSLLPTGAIAMAIETREAPPPAYPYLDTSLSFEERAADLVSRMTPEEKYKQLQNGRNPNAPAIPRLGVDEYQWWSEALHGVARDGTATSFPTGLGIGATWDPELVQEMMSVASDEIREKFNTVPRSGWHGLSYWSPTINLNRDPRWGRAEESYGEDPFLTSQIAGGFVRGLQGAGEDDRYIKSFATVKHFMANNSESNRHSGSSDFDERTLREYYGYAFQSAVEDADVESVMTSYNRVNGIPATVNLHMLDDLLRRTWGFDGYVVTDCDTLNDIKSNHPWRPNTPGLEWENEWNTLPAGWTEWEKNQSSWDNPEAAALSLMSGTDANCGTSMANGAKEAIERGLMSEGDVDVALVRMFTSRMKSGEFDPDEMVKYSGADFQKGTQIHAQDHRQLAEDSSDQSVVLLKNEPAKGGQTPILPLDGKEIQNLVVVGDLADEVILGDYSTYEPKYTSTPKDGIQDAWRRASGNPKATVTYIPGVQSSSGNYLMNIRGPQLCSADGTLVRSVDWTKNNGIQGCKVEGNPPNIGYNSKGTNWVKFNEVDFTGVKNVKVDMAGDGNACPTTVEVRIGGPEGQLITKMTRGKGNSGGWGNYDTYTFDTPIDGGYDTKQSDVYFVFKETVGDASFTPAEKQAIQNADAVVAYVGTKEGQNGYLENSDGANLNLPDGQTQMVQGVLKLNPNTVVYIQAVSEINVEPFKNQAPAILWCTYNGQAQGNAAGRLLFGERNPSAKLPFTWYTDINQLDDVKSYAIRPSDPNAPEGTLGRTYQYFTGDVSYPFGHGLSYADFEYSNLKLSKKSVTPNDTITVSFDVKNTSAVDGAEVAQVYIVSPGADQIDRPARRLKGFDKQTIAAGETKRFSIDIPVEDLYYWDESKSIQSYDQGLYTIEVGSSSGDTRETDFFSLNGKLTPKLKTVRAIPTGHILDLSTPDKTISTKLSASRNDQSFVDLGTTTVSYASSKPGVAAVSADGVVTAVGAGTTTITATVTEKGITKTDSFPVVVRGDAVKATGIFLDGQALKGFSPDTNGYTVDIQSLDAIPYVTGTAGEGCTVSVTQATPDSLKAFVRVTQGSVYGTYTISFKFTPPPEPTQPITPTDFTKIKDKDGLADAGWSIVRENAEKWKLGANGLTITMEWGDLYNNYNSAKNIFKWDNTPAGDWLAETKISLTGEPTQSYQQAGLMAYQDDGNYLKVNYQKGKIEINSEIGGVFTDKATASKDFTGTNLWIRLEKKGDTYTAWYSSDGTEYTKLGSKEHKISNVKLALIAINGEQNPKPDLDVTYEYLKTPELSEPIGTDHSVTVKTKGASVTYASSVPGKFPGQVGDDATVTFTVTPDAGKPLAEGNITVTGTAGSVTKTESGGVWTVTVPNVKGDIILEAFVPGALPAVKAVTPVASVSVPFGTSAADLKLPRVSFTLSDGTVQSDVRVNWQCAAYNPDKAGTYTFEAPLPVKDKEYLNPNGLKAKCDVIVEAKTTYTVTVTGGTLTGGATSGRFEEGAPVTITADKKATEGKSFQDWTATGVKLADTKANPVTFTMPGKAVTLTANFAEAAKAASIKVDGKALGGFDPDKLTYDVSVWGGLPQVTATATGEVKITQATTQNPTAKVVVTEGDVSRTYAITFHLLPETNRATNPYLPLWEHIPDGEPHTFEDPDNTGKYRVYVYGSHDNQNNSTYCGYDHVVWSAPVEDLGNWRKEGDIAYKCGGLLYAPDAVEKDGKYYLYTYDLGHGQSVAVSDRPGGPFVNMGENGGHLGSNMGADPAVLVDDDGKMYGYWGYQNYWQAEIDPNTMQAIESTKQKDVIPSCNQPGEFQFYEGASIRKVEGKYVMVYCQKPDKDPENGVIHDNYRARLAYAYSDHPLGPWSYGGVIIDNGGELLLNGKTSYPDGNVHGGITKAGDQWYIFYHRMTNKSEFSRQAMLEPIEVKVDPAPGGKVEIKQAEMTSQGANTAGMDAYQRYDAGIACYLTEGGYITTDYSETSGYNPVAGLKNGSVVGYKYLDFGSGAGGDENLRISMDLKPKGTTGRIDIFIDDPNNGTRKTDGTGTLIGSIGVPGQAGEYYTATASLANVTGRHAVFFVMSGVGGGEICEINAFSFDKTDAMFYDDFTGALGQWHVTGEASVADGAVTLAPGDLLVSGVGADWSSYAVTMAVESGDASLQLRRGDAKNYYTAKTDGGEVLLTVTSNGTERELARAPYESGTGGALELEVKCLGSDIQVLVDGNALLMVSDETHAMGGIALGAAGASARISSVQVRGNEAMADLTQYAIFMDGEPLPGFSMGTTTYRIPMEGADIPNITAATNNSAVRVSVAQASVLPGSAQVRFSGPSGTAAYTIIFCETDPKAVMYDFKGLTDLPSDWDVVNRTEGGVTMSEDGAVITTTGLDGLNAENQLELKVPLTGDWTVETHMTLDKPLSSNWQKCGIYVVKDDQNYIVADQEHDSSAKIQLFWNKDGKPQHESPTVSSKDVTDMYFRMRRLGTDVELEYSLDGKTYQYLGKETLDSRFDDDLSLRIFATHQSEGNPEMKLTVEYCSVLAVKDNIEDSADLTALETLADAIGSGMTVPTDSYADSAAIAAAAQAILAAREDLGGAEVNVAPVRDHYALTITKGGATVVTDPFQITQAKGMDSLKPLIIAAEALMERDYTAASWVRLERALERAYAVEDAPDPSDYEIAAAYDLLKAAKDGLRTAFTVAVDDAVTHGTITVDAARVVEGDTVTVTVTPDENYEIVADSLRAYKTGDETVAIAITGNTFTMPAYSVTVTAEFKSVPVTGVALDRETLSVYTGSTGQLTAIVTPADATNQALTWVSSDVKVATVSETGLVTAVSNGTATITVTTQDGGFTAACTVTVTTYTAPPSGGGGSTGGGSKDTVTVKNPDGSTTTTVTDKKSGAVTETTEWPDGKQVETITAKNGDRTVTIITKDGKKAAEIVIPAEIPAPEKPFADVPADHWSKTAVDFVAGLGLFTGTSAGIFDGTQSVTRATLTTVLHRLSGKVSGGENGFEDVADGAWYADSVAWAVENGIVTGNGAGFDPNGNITREALAAMLYRYAMLLGMDTQTKGGKLSEFADSGSVSTWASDAMAWCVESGILKGSGGKLNPSGTATRAEVAVMLQRFIENLSK